MEPINQLIIPLSFDDAEDCMFYFASPENFDKNRTEGVRFCLRTQACIATLRRLTKTAMSLISYAFKDKALLYTLELALFEACSNVVRHAYVAPEQGELELAVVLCPLRYILFEITDWGSGFNAYPVKVQTPDPEEEDGRGLLIIHGLADHFSICKKGNATILRICFVIEENKWRTCELPEEETD